MGLSHSCFCSSLSGKPRWHVVESRSEDWLDATSTISAAGELVQSLVTSTDGGADRSEGGSSSALIVETGDAVAVRDVRSKMLRKGRGSDTGSVATCQNRTKRFGSIDLHELGELNIVARQFDRTGIDAG